ncbi:GTPase-activating protein and VPS9 domain-containing protein 1 [Hondaea fermentalgiana]|uniref:GTPase-activating protein and VPS9 domain-containing protein 1 n=1 Tax=Hondaea fermentalgiana TaxID=2315210 RepID=A0A2R5GH95_9STRA|nr:GTPase-activating protein and VPS9 domain-containing protein 1 [Hondaea fermentalgiana]|eukprot:GBG27224.1 GTPase-activating protein and VPS9 domain-containing protein 1 [Hondaea fermentalgiana]
MSESDAHAHAPVYEPIFGDDARGNGDASYDPFASLQSDGAVSGVSEERRGGGVSNYEQRRQDLLDSARAAQAAFVTDHEQGRQPEEDDTDSEGNQSGAGSTDDKRELPPGFAFPVTTQIMQFLNKISTQPGPPLPGEATLRALQRYQSNGSHGSRTSGASTTSSQPRNRGSGDADSTRRNDEHTLSDRENVSLSEQPPSSTPANTGSAQVEDASAQSESASQENETPNSVTASKPKKTQTPNGTDSTAKSSRKSAYATFIQTLKEPRAADTVAAIKALVLHFFKEAAALQREDGDAAPVWDDVPGQDSALARQFQAAMRKLEAKMRANAQWKNDCEEAWAATCEALEKFVLLKLHGAFFCATDRERTLDQALCDRIKSLTFVRASHLDVHHFGRNNLEQWQKAGSELAKMNEFKSPRDKVICVLNACRLLSSLLGDDGRLPGADDLLPALIFVLLKENPRNVHSNVSYIASFRNPARLKGEAGYFFTQLASAAAFVQTLDSSMLSSVSASQFDALVAHCQRKLAEDAAFSFGWEGIRPEEEAKVLAEAQGVSHGAEAILPLRDAQQETSDVAVGLDKAAVTLGELLSESEPSPASTVEAWKAQRLRFKDRTAESLTLGEVSELLEEYKALASVVDALAVTRSPDSAKNGATLDDDDSI